MGQIAWRGLRTLLRIRVGSHAASWANTLKQDLAFDELVEMKTSIEHKAQGESGGDQRHSPLVQQRELLCHHCGTLRWWRRGCTQRGNIPAEAGKYSKQQPKSYDGSMIVGKEFGGRLTQPTPGAAGTNAAPPSSERSDDDS